MGSNGLPRICRPVSSPASGSELRAVASPDFLLAGSTAPPLLADPDTLEGNGVWGERFPPLAQMAKGEVLTLSMPKDRKMNG